MTRIWLKYDDNSNDFKEWTTKKIKEQARSLDFMINNPNGCYGSRDITLLDALLCVLDERGINYWHVLNFRS